MENAKKRVSHEIVVRHRAATFFKKIEKIAEKKLFEEIKNRMLPVYDIAFEGQKTTNDVTLGYCLTTYSYTYLYN